MSGQALTVEELAGLENAPVVRPEVAAVALWIEQRLRETDHRRPGEENQTIRAAYQAAFIGASLHTEEWRQRLARELTLPPGVTCLRIEVRR